MDIEILDVTVDGNRIEGVFLAVDKLLDADHGHMPQPWQHAAQFVGVVYPIGIGRARACDGFKDQREADLFSSFGPGSDCRLNRS